MYIALAIMFAGMLLGRILRGYLNGPLLGHLTMAAILILLFLLGVAIGGNSRVFAALPTLGAQALVLTFACLTGSILCAALATPLIRPKSVSRDAR